MALGPLEPVPEPRGANTFGHYYVVAKFEFPDGFWDVNVHDARMPLTDSIGKAALVDAKAKRRLRSGIR